MVDRPGHQFLARAALTRDQHRGVRLRDLPDELENLLHRLALADDALGVILFRQQRLVTDDAPHVVGGLERRRDERFEFRHVERFQHVIVRAEFHRLDGRLRRAVGGHHDDQQFRIQAAQLAQHLQSVAGAHANVHDDKVGPLRRDLANGLGAVARFHNLQFGRLEIAAECAPNIGIVINDQNLVHGGASYGQPPRLASLSRILFGCSTHLGRWQPSPCPWSPCAPAAGKPLPSSRRRASRPASRGEIERCFG